MESGSARPMGPHVARMAARLTAILAEPESETEVMVLRGAIVGPAVCDLAAQMEKVLATKHDVILDVSEVDRWSVVAQAMLMTTARRKTARGEQLIIRGASTALREQSRQLGLFEQT